MSCYPADVAIETLAPRRSGSTPDPGPIVASLARTDRLPRGLALQKRLAAERADGDDRRPAAPPRAPRGPDPRPQRRPGPRPRRRRGAGRARHRGHPGRARRRGHLPRSRPARRLPDPRACPTAACWSGRSSGRSRRRWSRPAPRSASRRPGATATRAAGATRTARIPRKIGALGLRVERGVSYHGIALNVDGRPRRLRPDRPVRHAGRRLDLDRARAGRRPEPTPATTASVERAGRHLRARPSPPSLGAPLAGVLRRWPPVCSSCARTRSPAGGSRRSSTAPSTATGSRAPPSRSTTACRLRELLDARAATASASGCSRTSRSTSSAPSDDARELDSGLAPGRARPGARDAAAGGRSSRRPASTGRSTRSAPR